MAIELSAVARTSLAAMDAGLINLRQEAGEMHEFNEVQALADALLSISVQLSMLEDDLRARADQILRERVDASTL